MSVLNILDQAFLNFSILVGMISLLGLTYPYRSSTRLPHQLARWVLLAGSGLLLLHHSMAFEPGVRTDLRFLPVALATILGGPWYALSVSLPLLAYRVVMGGIGVWPAMVANLLTILASLYLARRRNQFQMDVPALLRSGLLIALAGNLAYLFLPGSLPVFFITLPVKAVCMALVIVLLQTRFRLVGSFQDYRRMAFTDKLTSLSNRRQFDEDLRPNQAEPPAFLMLLDIDHFKEVNDRYGHDFGDQVLTLTAQLIQANLRHWDGAYRYGGEEFAVLLRHCSPEQARMVAERVRQSVERQILEQLGCRVTVSIGAVPLPQRIEASASLRAADHALYTAKHSGRNQVIWSSGRADEAAPS